MSIYLRNIIRFLFLVLIQVLILNEISLHWFADSESALPPPYIPLIYPLFILLLPYSTPVWFLLIAGFGLGLSIDTFFNTGGVHAAACLIMAYGRQSVLSNLLPARLTTEYPNLTPSIKSLGWIPFLTYSILLLFIHHLVYLGIEVWSVHSILYFFTKLLFSLFTCMILIVIYSLLAPGSLNAYSE